MSLGVAQWSGRRRMYGVVVWRPVVVTVHVSDLLSNGQLLSLLVLDLEVG
ncbi:hypothetical protein ABCR94_16955 [Streptomyces sp. 21So2-11]